MSYLILSMASATISYESFLNLQNEFKNINIQLLPESVYNTVQNLKVKSAFVTKHANDSLRATSKLHRFKPAVQLADALRWADHYVSFDITFLFEDEKALYFFDSHFGRLELEDAEDPEAMEAMEK